MGIEQMKLYDNEKISKIKNIWPPFLGPCSNCCGNLWDTIHNSLNHKLRSCSHNSLHTRGSSLDERGSQMCK